MTTITLLGPQRLRPTVGAAIRRLAVSGPIAVVTAGWQEREPETADLQAHVERPVVNLELYRRAEESAVEDPDLFAALHERQESLTGLQRLYRIRLDHTLAAARQLLARPDDDEHLEGARRDAIGALRALDEEHVDHILAVHRAFDSRWEARERPTVKRHREELKVLLESCSALAIAGGHVAVLLNRLRLFGALDLAQELPVVAWSAGAMVLAERIVLFHDRPPQGAGNAEVLEVGLGRLPGILPLPDARRRLRLADPLRVSLFSRRFAPQRCVLLDEASELTRREGGWWSEAGFEQLTTDGEVRRVEPPEAAA